VVGGTATAPTVRTATLDVIAADHPPAADWSNNSHKITSLASGSASSDAAAFGQTLAGGTGTPMTTAGDLITGGASGVPQRLAVGSAGQVLGVSGAAPAWLTPSGEFLRTPSQYAPGTQTAATVSTTTMAAFDSTNINTGSFTVPASGSVLVSASFVLDFSLSSKVVAVGLAEHGGVTPIIGNLVLFMDNGANIARPVLAQFLITGLVAASTHNLDLLGAATSGATASILAFGQSTTTPTLTGVANAGAPVLMTVQAV